METTPSPSSSPPSDAAVADAFVDADDSDSPGDGLDFDFLKGAGDPAADGAARTAEFGGADGDAEPAPQTPAAPAAPTPSAAPVVQPPAGTPSAGTPAAPAAAAPAVVLPPAPVAPVAPAQTPAAAPTVAAQPAPAAPGVPVDPVKAYGEWRGNTIKTLAQTSFALDDATVEEIEANPKEALPRLASHVYLTAVENTTAALHEALPGIIERHLENRKTTDSNVNEFFGAYPALKDRIEDVAKIGVTFRQLNPGLTKEQFIVQVGEYCHTTFGIPKPQAAASAAPTSQSIRPHVPLAASAPRAAPGPVTFANPFEAMAGQRGVVSSDDLDPDDA